MFMISHVFLSTKYSTEYIKTDNMFFPKDYLIFPTTTYCDAAESYQFGLQDPATPSAQGMIFFHNFLFAFLSIIAVLVVWLLFVIVVRYADTRSDKAPLIFAHSSFLEFLWTIIPSIFLLIIAVPSFMLLYSLDEFSDKPHITVHVMGSQ
jgi:heme/copper-type cytochrome/quinol oxidase subunit 2